MARQHRNEIGWSRFAWQGVRVDVPDTWNLGAVSGDARRGQCRLDDDEIARLEIQWERGRSGMDPALLAAEHVRRLERTARRKGVPFQAVPDARIARPAGMEAACFEWRSDFHAFNLLTFCPACRRVTLVRVFERTGERLRPVAARVFESLRDHAENGRVPWSLFGLTCIVPERFVLQGSTLNLQRIELRFRDARNEVAVARSSLAEMQLRGKSLADWLRAAYPRELRGFHLRFDEQPYRGHPGLRFSGALWLSPIRSLFGPGARLEGLLWRCEDSDKLFVARWLGREEPEEFERLCGSIVCHGRAEP